MFELTKQMLGYATTACRLLVFRCPLPRLLRVPSGSSWVARRVRLEQWLLCRFAPVSSLLDRITRGVFGGWVLGWRGQIGFANLDARCFYRSTVLVAWKHAIILPSLFAGYDGAQRSR